MNSKSIAVLVVLLIAALGVRWYVFRTPPEPPKPVLAIVTGGSQDFWKLVGNGARAAADELQIELSIQQPEKEEDAKQQTKILEGIDLDKVQGVGVSPLDAEEQTPLINKIAEKDFVVTFDSDAPDSKRESYVGTSNIAAGRTCANVVREAIPEGGKAVVFLANLTKENMIERKEGFEDAISKSTDAEGNPAPEYEVVDYLVDDGDVEKSANQLKEVLKKHPDLKCLVGLNGHHGAVFMKTLKEEGKLGKLKVVTFDESKQTLDGVESGDIYATIAQDPYQYGYETVRLLASLCGANETQLPLPGSYSTLNISTQVIRKANLDEFRKQLETRLAASH